jgi:hypothetical protein
MKRNPVISFFGGLIISGVLYGIVYLLFLFATFNLAGGETLRQIESQRTAFLIITIMLAVLAAGVARQYLKKGNKFTAYGISILPMIAVVIVAAVYIVNFNYSTQFDKTTWEQSDEKPFNIAATLVKQNKLKGLTRQEVKAMLGQGAEENWTLTIYFQHGKVTDAGLRLPWLGI